MLFLIREVKCIRKSTHKLHHRANNDISGLICDLILHYTRNKIPKYPIRMVWGHGNLMWPTWGQAVWTDGSFRVLGADVKILALLFWQWHVGYRWLLRFSTQGVEDKSRDTAAHASLFLHLQEMVGLRLHRDKQPTASIWGELFNLFKADIELNYALVLKVI